MKPLWTGLALLTPTLAGLTPHFQPTKGLELTKTFQTVTILDFEELTSSFNGADVPPEFLPEMDMHFETKARLVVHDRYDASADGAPLRMQRTYDEIEETHDMSVLVAGMADESGELDGKTELLGCEVVFDWTDGEASAVFVDGDGDTELLDGLRADLDFCGFLPADDVEVGDTWELDAGLFAAILMPGGDLSIEGVRDPSEAPRGEAEFSGSWKAQVVGADGSERVRVQLSGNLEEVYEYPTELDHIPVADGTATEVMTVEYEVEGELLWDLKGGHVHAVSLQGEMIATTVTTKDAGQPGPDFASTLTLVGEWSFELGVEAMP